MNKNSVLLICAFLLTVLQSFAQTSEETRQLTAFNGIKVSNAIEVELEKGDSHQIHIIASGLDLEKVETNVSNRQLEIKLGRGNFKSTSVKVKVTYVDLDQVEATTASRVFVKDPIQAKNVRIQAATSSYVEVEVNSSSLKLDAATNAKIHIKGEAEQLELRVVTNGEINGRNLQVENAEVSGNTAGKAEIAVSESIRGSAGTAAKIKYYGEPRQIDVKENTGGSIDRGN